MLDECLYLLLLGEIGAPRHPIALFAFGLLLSVGDLEMDLLLIVPDVLSLHVLDVGH